MNTMGPPRHVLVAGESWIKHTIYMGGLLADVSPVTMLPDDDRIEVSDGPGVDVCEWDPPVLGGTFVEWPHYASLWVSILSWAARAVPAESGGAR